MTNEMQQSRLNILRKGLIGPEIEQIHKVIDQKISLALQDFKDEINSSIKKNEFAIKDKLVIVDELLSEFETLQKQVKTNLVYGVDATNNVTRNVGRVEERLNMLINSMSPGKQSRYKPKVTDQPTSAASAYQISN